VPKFICLNKGNINDCHVFNDIGLLHQVSVRVFREKELEFQDMLV